MTPWFRFTSVSSDWTVVRGDEDEFPDLVGAEAVTLPTKSLVVVHENLTYPRACRAFIHELLHTDLSNPGESELLAVIFGCKVSTVKEREEYLVTYLAPRLADTLIRNQFLELPPFAVEKK